MQKVRGISPTNTHSALAPVPLKDGRYMVGEETVDDPDNADVADTLLQMPTATLAALDPVIYHSNSPEDLEALAALPPLPPLKVRGT
jgi:hypothetical protein